MEDGLKIVGIIVLVFFIGYIIIKSLKLQINVLNNIREGMTTTDNSNDITTNNSQNLNTNIGSGAISYATSIKTNIAKLVDQLQITKYKNDYENVIINMEDYINLLMLQSVLNININDSPDKVMKQIVDLGTLNNGRDALNQVMKYVDTAN